MSLLKRKIDPPYLCVSPLGGGRSVGFAPVISFHGDVIRFGEHGADSFKSRLAWGKYTEEML